MSANASSYYIKRQGRIHGPYSPAQFQKFKSAGKLKDDDFIREGKAGKWIPSAVFERSVANLQDAQKAPPAHRRRSSNQAELVKRQKRQVPKSKVGKQNPWPLVLAAACVLVTAAVAITWWPAEKATPMATATETEVAEASVDSNVAHHESLLEYLPDNLHECLIEGEAARGKQGVLVLDGAQGVATALQIPIVLPAEYQLQITVRQPDTEGAFRMCLPHQGHPTCFVVDAGAKDGVVSGIGSMGGPGFAEGSTTASQKRFVDEQSHLIEVTSNADGLFIDWDGARLTEFTGPAEQLSLDWWIKNPNKNLPVLRADRKGRFIVEQMTLKTQSSKAPTPAIPPYPSSDASFAIAEKQFGPAFREVIALAKKIDGAVTIETSNDGGQRLRFSLQSQNDRMKWVSVAGVDFTPLGQITGPVFFSASATTNWPEAILPEFNPSFQLEKLEFHLAKNLTASVLSKFPPEHISWLSLHQTKLDDDIAESLSAMTSLKLAHLRGIQIGEQNAAALASLTNLKTLGISSNLTIDSAVKKIAQSQSIVHLKIENETDSQFPLSDQSLASLETMSSLEALSLKKTGVSQQAVDRFKVSHPNIKLEFVPREESSHDVFASLPRAESKTLEAVRAIPTALQGFERLLTSAKRDLKSSSTSKVEGYVVVGRIRLEGNDDPESITSQLPVGKDGFFARAISDLRKPIGFVHQKYDTLNLIVPTSATVDEDNVIDVGDIQMTKTGADRLGTIEGTVEVPQGVDLPLTKLSISPVHPRGNWVFGGGYRPGGKQVSLLARAKSDGSIASEPLSPGSYYCWVRHQDCVDAFQVVQVHPGTGGKLKPFKLERPLKIELEFRLINAGEPDFKSAMTETTTVAGGGTWTSGKRSNGLLRFNQQDRRVSIQNIFGGSKLQHLGEGALEDFLDCSPGAATTPPQGDLQSGHVYLLDQVNMKRHVLFRAEVKQPSASPTVTASDESAGAPAFTQRNKPKRVFPASTDPEKLFASQQKLLSVPVTEDWNPATGPLHEVVSAVSSAFNLPLWLNEASLNGKVEATTLIQLDLSPGPLGPQLVAELRNFKLALIPPLSEEGDWEVTTLKEAEQRLFTLNYDVSDFAKQGLGFSPVIGLIYTHVPADWVDNTGKGGTIEIGNGQRKILQITQHWQAHDAVSTLIDQLRRGPKSSVYRQFLISTAQLRKPIKGSWDFQQASLSEVVEFIGLQEGIDFRIDQHELSLEGISLDLPVTTTASKGSLGQNLDQLLQPHELALVPLQDGGRQWTITTKPAARSAMLTIIHPVRMQTPPPYKLSPYIAKIRAIPNTSWFDFDNSGGAITPLKSMTAIGLAVTQTWDAQAQIARLLK